LKLASRNTRTLSFPAALSLFGQARVCLSHSLSSAELLSFALLICIAIGASYYVVRSCSLLLRFNKRRDNPSCMHATDTANREFKAPKTVFMFGGRTAGSRKKQLGAIQYCSSDIHVLFHAFFNSLAFLHRNQMYSLSTCADCLSRTMVGHYSRSRFLIYF